MTLQGGDYIIFNPKAALLLGGERWQSCRLVSPFYLHVIERRKKCQDMQKCSVLHLQEVTGGGQQRHRDQGMHLRARLGKGSGSGRDAFLQLFVPRNCVASLWTSCTYNCLASFCCWSEQFKRYVRHYWSSSLQAWSMTQKVAVICWGSLQEGRELNIKAAKLYSSGSENKPAF